MLNSSSALLDVMRLGKNFTWRPGGNNRKELSSNRPWASVVNVTYMATARVVTWATKAPSGPRWLATVTWEGFSDIFAGVAKGTTLRDVMKPSSLVAMASRMCVEPSKAATSSDLKY